MKRTLAFQIELHHQDKCHGCQFDASFRRHKSASGCTLGLAPRTVGHEQIRDPRCVAAEKLAQELVK